MVNDRLTDGKRIGQLLASELTGLERGPLGAVSVVDADPDVEPTADGALAFRIEKDGEELGEVTVTSETARLQLPEAALAHPDRDDVTITGDTIVAHSGAAVKVLVDAVAEVIEPNSDGS
jgi:hypothetical protein